MTGLDTSKLAVVIVNWERPSDTLECLESIDISNHPRLQVIVVDNGSKDDSIQRIKGFNTKIQLIELQENCGFAGGYNAGIHAALKGPSERVLLLNNDTIIRSNLLDVLACSDWDVAVPKILYYDDPKRIWSAGSRWHTFPPRVTMNEYNKPNQIGNEKSKSLEYATGCALLVKRAVFEKTNGFDERYQNYMEDYDFCYRVRKAGFSIGYEPSAIVLHKVSRSLGPHSSIRWHYMGKNTVLFYLMEDRFPVWMLWSYLLWFFFRETIQGNIRLLPSFWEGVQQGLIAIKG